MSRVFHRNPYSPRSGFWRPGPMLMASVAFVAGIACTVALSHFAPKQTTPNPWGPEAQKAGAVTPPTASPAPTRSEPVRVVAADRIASAPRAADRNTGATAPRSVATEARHEPTTKPTPPARLNDYEREALAKAVAAKANAELAGGLAGAASQHLADAPGIVAHDDSAEAKHAQEVAEKAEKARKAKARKLARERQLARARAHEQARAYAYQSGPAYAQDYGFRGGGFFRSGGIW